MLYININIISNLLSSNLYITIFVFLIEVLSEFSGIVFKFAF